MHVPSLTRSAASSSPRGLVLLLHGGADKGTDPIDESSLSFRRSRWMMAETQHRFHESGVDVWLLRYAVKGWNGHLSSPVPDARWALSQVRREHGSLPVVLLGHSMGGRTAAAVADDPNVVGVVALAPWLPARRARGPAGRQAPGRGSRPTRQDHPFQGHVVLRRSGA